MRAPAALLAMLLLAPAAAALPLGVRVLADPGPAEVFVSNVGSYAIRANDFFCAGRTLAVTLVVASSQGSAQGAMVATDGADCTEAWAPIAMEGSWASGWQGTCSGELPVPCIVLDIGPPGAEGWRDFVLDVPNGAPRVGQVRGPEP